MALDFPSSPVNGQVYDNFYYDSAKGIWKSLSSGASPNYLVNPTITDAVITATASTPSTIPLTVNGAASQSASLQEWKNSAGIALSKITSNGSINVEGVGTQARFYGVNNAAGSDQYNFLLVGGNDTGTKAIHFVNSSTRTADGGVNAYTIRNDGGPLILGSTSYDTTIYNKVRMPNQPAFRAYNVSGASGSNLSFATSDTAFNGRNAGWNGSRFTAPIAGVYVFSFAILVGAGANTRILFRINGTYSTTYGDTLESNYSSYTYAGMSMAFFLNVNDYVELYNEQTGVYGSSFGSFSGFYVG